MTDFILTERADRWLLPVAGQQITRCCADYAAVLLLLLNGIEFAIEAELSLILPTGQRHLLKPDGDDGLALAPILSVRRRNVTQGVAFKDGRLVLDIDDGSRIEVPADHKYESWNLTGPGGLMIVSTPGGDLAIWLSRDSGTSGA
jgi:hypothetical protein